MHFASRSFFGARHDFISDMGAVTGRYYRFDSEGRAISGRNGANRGVVTNRYKGFAAPTDINKVLSIVRERNRTEDLLKTGTRIAAHQHGNAALSAAHCIYEFSLGIKGRIGETVETRRKISHARDQNPVRAKGCPPS